MQIASELSSTCLCSRRGLHFPDASLFSSYHASPWCCVCLVPHIVDLTVRVSTPKATRLSNLATALRLIHRRRLRFRRLPSR